MDKYSAYRAQIRAALDELSKLSAQKNRIELEMVKLRKLVLANVEMLPDEEQSALIERAQETMAKGITESIRRVFNANPKGLMPVEVREKLLEDGFDASSQTNFMASIHSVIRRLVESGEIEPQSRPNGERIFRTVGKSLG